jgi:hypothetical protein
VALLADQAQDALVRGQVGTVVEPLDAKTVLVEFSDVSGQTYAIAPCTASNLMILHHDRQVA